jgi:iron complex outermembrane receptor protein
VQQQMRETNKGTERFTQLNGRADYEIISGLKVGVLGTLSDFNNQREFFQPDDVGTSNNGSINSGRNTTSYHGDIHASYVKNWGKSNLNATVVYEYNDFKSNSFGGSAYNILVGSLGAWNLGAAPSAYQSANSNQSEYQLISYLGRVMYNYDQKYFLTASFRNDGSSKFGPEHAWGKFPAVSAAWLISREPFMKEVNWLNNLKLNIGWGITGDQDNISPYSKLQL